MRIVVARLKYCVTGDEIMHCVSYSGGRFAGDLTAATARNRGEGDDILQFEAAGRRLEVAVGAYAAVVCVVDEGDCGTIRIRADKAGCRAAKCCLGRVYWRSLDERQHLACLRCGKRRPLRDESSTSAL